MPRGPRLDVEGALHHVMVRGIERRDLFRSDADREDLVERLALLAPETGTAVYAWSLMPNHWHLLVRSGPAGLSTFMRRLQTGYAGAFNRRHRRSGHLFQNRFKSILVEEEAYFLELTRYLHLNPLRAEVVRSLRGLDTYPWSGHAVLMGARDAAWQDADFVLGQFGSTAGRARQAYRRFVAEGVPLGRRPELSGGGLVRSIGGCEQVATFRRGRERWQADERVLGSGEFVGEVQRQAAVRAERKVSAEEIEPALLRLLAEVSAAHGVRAEEVRSAGRVRAMSRARAALAHQAVRRLSIPVSAVARFLGVSPPAVVWMIARVAAAGAGGTET
jgi:REP element-mobilizing transposase RayT